MRFATWISRLLMIVSLLILSSYAGSAIRKANFYKVFSAKDYYGADKDMTLRSNVMSNDGKIVAFYGSYNAGDVTSRKLFIHNFESTSGIIPRPLGRNLVI